ncbi:MAG: hypothetical protein OES32_07555 [Acidobacteriota bacterium]|nr:hypothetical protein [Acidobacteriota bacterium]
MRTALTRSSWLAMTLLMLATVVSAGTKDKELSVRIEGEDGADISFSISGGFVDGILEGLAGADVDCDVTTDDDTRAMLRHLDRRGEGAKYRFRDDEGKLIKARRRHGQLELEIAKGAERDAHVSLPWAVAECMLGHRTQLSRDARAELELEDEGSIRIRIE